MENITKYYPHNKDKNRRELSIPLLNVFIFVRITHGIVHVVVFTVDYCVTCLYLLQIRFSLVNDICI